MSRINKETQEIATPAFGRLAMTLKWAPYHCEETRSVDEAVSTYKQRATKCEDNMKEKKINREEVRYIAHLARLELSKEEEEKFSRQLGEILAYVDKLKEVDTRSVRPTSHVFTLKNIFREDERKDSLPVEEVLRNAPQQRRTQFQVPRVIE